METNKKTKRTIFILRRTKKNNKVRGEMDQIFKPNRELETLTKTIGVLVRYVKGEKKATEPATP